jgi:hypothetical protein
VLKLFSLRAQKTSPQALTFKVSVQKTAVILIGLPLCVVFLSLTAFNILSLFSVLFVLMTICHGVVLF